MSPAVAVSFRAEGYLPQWATISRRQLHTEDDARGFGFGFVFVFDSDFDLELDIDLDLEWGFLPLTPSSFSPSPMWSMPGMSSSLESESPSTVMSGLISFVSPLLLPLSSPYLSNSMCGGDEGGGGGGCEGSSGLGGGGDGDGGGGYGEECRVQRSTRHPA